MSIPGSEEVQEETVDLQPDEQETHSIEQETHHSSSTQTEAFDYLYWSVESLSIMVCPRNDTSTQTEEFDYLFAESARSKPYDKKYFRETMPQCFKFSFENKKTVSLGGCTSDKYFAKNCGLLNKLLPGDLVIEDRGFTIHDGVALKQAQLVIPAFTKGKELDPIDVEKTRGIAHVRIHVERVIGLLHRKYTILENTLSVDLLTSNQNGNPEVQEPMINCVIRVCSGRVNLCCPIVPKIHLCTIQWNPNFSIFRPCKLCCF